MLAQQFDRVVMWIPLHHVFLIADLLRRKVLPEKGKRRGLGAGCGWRLLPSRFIVVTV